MRFLIRCDMEGITGVTTYDEVIPGKPRYDTSRDLLMQDLRAVIEGLRRSDPYCEVVLYDEHYDGRNIWPSALPTRCVAICGKPPYRADWVGGLDPSIDALLMVGFHAMAGTPGGTLPHTYEHDILAIEVNGALVGEVGVEAALAGEMDIPVILYSGDSAGAAEAERLMPGLTTVAVKQSLGESAAACLAPLDTAEILRDAGQEVANPGRWPQPLRLGRPVRLEITLADTPYRAAFAQLHGEALSGDVAVLTRGSLADAWADYWHMKMAAQAAR